MPTFRVLYALDISYCDENEINHRKVYDCIHLWLVNAGWVFSESRDWQLADCPQDTVRLNMNELRNSFIDKYGQGIWKLLESWEVEETVDILALPYP